MHGKIQALRDGIDRNREAHAIVSRQLQSIYDGDISRPLPGHLARLFHELGPNRLTIVDGVNADERARDLSAGGDDDPAKPFATLDFIAGFEALLRRSAESRDTVLQVGPLTLDLIERTANRGERTIDLLPREFRLLEYMMRHKEQILTRAILLKEVWNYKFVPETNLVDVHMGRVRRKVDAPHELPMIYNVRGVGFVLRAPA
jgi:DNA-binding response OmpR family regulator